LISLFFKIDTHIQVVLLFGLDYYELFLVGLKSVVSRTKARDVSLGGCTDVDPKHWKAIVRALPGHIGLPEPFRADRGIRRRASH
jgi:hypothetical protein